MLSQLKKKRHNSTASIATNKGLLNEPGENNCFLNSAIQVLWHLDVFRRSFRLLTGHACMGASCIFCALKDIFQQFQYSKDHALPPNVLRSALAESFQQQNRFQLGLMDDAAECFEIILNRIHLHIGNTKLEDVCTAPHCIPHQKFGLTLIQHSVCPCGATSEPLPFIEMVHYVSATALCAENEAMCHRYGISSTAQKFGKLIKVAGSWGDMRSCPSNCGQQVEMRNALMNCPDVVSIGIVWDSDEPEVKHITDLVNTLGTTLCLTDLFHNVVDDQARQMELYLVGMVCYYGKHYSTFFFHTKMRKWVYFDDAQVSEIGKRWSNVISKCIKGHHQPLLLLYSNPNATPVTVKTAPTQITMLPGYSHHRIIRDSLIEVPEVDSLPSEDEYQSPGYESSSTESVLAASLHSYKSSLSQKQSNSLKFFSQPSSTNVDDKQRTKLVKTKASSSSVATGGPSKSKDVMGKYQNKVASSQAEDVRKADDTRKSEESRPKRSAFQWNLTDDQEQRSNKKVGHYIEPQPANWTHYKPYNAQSSKLSPGKKNSNHKVGKQPSDASAEAAQGRRVPGDEREPSPTPSARYESSKHVMIGGRSPKHSRTSSHSSHSSASSLGRSSNKGTSTSGSDPINQPTTGAELSSTGTSTAPAPPPDISYRDEEVEEDLPTPPLPPKTRIPPRQSLHNDDELSSVRTHFVDNRHNLHFTAYSSESNREKPCLPTKPPTNHLLYAPSCGNGNTSINSYLGVLTARQAESEKLGAPERNFKSIRRSPSPDRCRSLFREVDALLDESRAADAAMDYTNALQLCLEATQTIEKIMMMDNLPEDCFERARIKHGDCINRSSILHRRKKIRLKTKSHDVGRARSSVADSDRHMKHSTNQPLIPTKLVESSTNHVASLPNDSNPSQTRKKDSMDSVSPSKSDKLLKELEKDDGEDSLIDFNKHGMTKFQHLVHNMFKKQHDLKSKKTKQQPVVLVSEKKNLNNSNNNRPEPESSKIKQPTGPNIFVFNKPKPDPTSVNVSQTLPTNRREESDATTEPPTGDEENVTSHGGAVEQQLVDSSAPTKPVEERSERRIVESPRFRSVTPTPQVRKSPPLSQQRRAKTPTPRTNKEMMRNKQSIGIRKGGNLKLQPQPTQSESAFNNKPGNNVKAPNPPVGSAGSPYPFSYPAWGSSPVSGPGFPPAAMPPEYYEHFYKLLQYYSTLSPDQQRNMFPFTPNGTPTVSPFSMYSTTTPPASTMHPAYVEGLRTQLGKNLSNFTNSVGRTTPHFKANNSNIYQSSKPKPVQIQSSPNLPTTSNLPSSQSTTMTSSSSRSSTRYNRTLPTERISDHVLQRRDSKSTDEVSPLRHDHVSSSAEIDQSKGSSANQSAASNHLQAKSREGMMKWAEEGKKRRPEANPEMRNRILQEFASRTRKDPMKSTILSTFAASNPPPGSAITTLSSDSKCVLCGLVDVPSGDKYCTSCRAYLSRLSPANASTRLKKMT